jgi:predicted nucleic acid-binding protein
MASYFDSGILAKLYCLEPNSPQAIALVRAEQAPVPLTMWQELEVKTALRLKAFRGEISDGQLDQSISDFETDIAAGLFDREKLDEQKLFATSERLSAQHARQTGCRTLDIVHVAAALVLGIREFVTTDSRQGRLAHAVGFNVRP